MGDPIVDSFLAGSAAPPLDDSIAASFTAGYGKVKRYPGDPISKIEERRAHPPPNARGSVKPEDDGSAWDYAAAVAKGVGGMLPDITGGATDPFAIVRNAVETGRTAAQYMGTPTGSAQAAISAVPVVGAPLAAVAQPARAYAEGRPPTHEENVSAVEGGTTLATMAALPAALRVANVLRARGAVVPEAGPVEAPAEPATSTTSGPVEAAPAESSPPAATTEAPNFPAFDEGMPGDEALADAAAQRFEGRSASEHFRKQIEADQLRRTPQAALDRETLPLDEFVKQRFPRAKLTEERGPEWTQSILASAPVGDPGFSIDPAPDELKAQGVDRQLVYRDPDGRPIGVANVVDGDPEITSPVTTAGRPLWELSPEELDREYEVAKAGERDIESALFGDEGGARYRALQRKANSVMLDHKTTDAAYAEIEKMEGGLSEHQRNRLYGIGDPAVLAEDIRAFQRGLNALDDSSPVALGRSLRWALTKIEDRPIEEMTTESQVAAAQMRHAFNIAIENNWNPQHVLSEAIRAASVRFGPHEADFMLRRFMRSESPTGAGSQAPLVRDFAVDKSQGLLAGRAVGAIANELDRAGAFEHVQEISPDAARFVQKAEARRARMATTAPPDAGGGEPPDDGGTPPTPPPTSGGGAAPPSPPPAIQGAASQPTPEPPPLPSVDDPQYGAALRTRYTGSVDVRVLEGNRIRSWMQKTLTPDEQNALSIMRDEKSQPGSTQALIDGTHPVYQEPNTSHAHVEAMSDVADLALHPTPAMLAADGVLDSYFAKTLKEGKEKGVIDSSIESSDYIPHLLQPAEGIEPGRTGSPGGISETTPFALKRKNPTILEAMARGLDPRTINAADAVSIYARRHGLAMAAQILENTLKESEIGKVATKDTAPADWVKSGLREREVPYHDRSGDESSLAVAHQALYVPQKIADALKPITEPNYMLKVPGWEKTQRFQDYIKSANVALAFFHLKAVTITAFNSMRLGPVDMMKAYMIGVDDPFFVDSERNLAQAGGKTSATGQTAEAYRALQPAELPSRVDAIRNLPVMRQLDAAAQDTSKLTFDIALRKTKVMDFASKDAAWIADHPNASDLELAEARRSTARTLNANYGGLNWEALGYTRTVHAILRATMFAPDWTISNLESVTQAARGGPGGAQARWYMARSIVGGIGATAAMTYFLTGKRPDQVPGSMKDKLFNVYLGDDEKGNHKFVNLFFAGAPNDAVNLAANVVDYGAGAGVGMSAAAKLNVLPRVGEHTFISNKDFMGRDIVPQGAGGVLGTALSIKNAAGEVAPVPFSVKNAAQMATDARREYSPAEYAAAMVAGVRPRHVADHGGKVPITETKWVDEPPKNSAWDILTGSSVYKRGK